MHLWCRACRVLPPFSKERGATCAWVDPPVVTHHDPIDTLACTRSPWICSETCYLVKFPNPSIWYLSDIKMSEGLAQNRSNTMNIWGCIRQWGLHLAEKQYLHEVFDRKVIWLIFPNFPVKNNRGPFFWSHPNTLIMIGVKLSLCPNTDSLAYLHFLFVGVLQGRLCCSRGFIVTSHSSIFHFTVRFHVAPQTTCPRRCIFALVALVGFLSCMCFQMNIQSLWPGRFIVTQVALIWFFSTMFVHMCFQMFCPKRWIVTLVAFIWFQSFVCFQMCSQVAFM